MEKKNTFMIIAESYERGEKPPENLELSDGFCFVEEGCFTERDIKILKWAFIGSFICFCVFQIFDMIRILNAL